MLLLVPKEILKPHIWIIDFGATDKLFKDYSPCIAFASIKRSDNNFKQIYENMD